MLALLQMPQLDDVNTCRVSRARSTAAPGASSTSITFSRLFASDSSTAAVPRATVELSTFGSVVHLTISSTSSRRRRMPSETRNPAASSRSCPGVRITTAML
jgi:hypothetical protein